MYGELTEKLIKSVLDADEAPVVICDLEHTVRYMNPAAVKRYARRGGAALLGRSVKNCHGAESNRRIDEVLEWFRKSPENDRVYTSRNDKENKDVYMVALRDVDGTLIGYYEKHMYRTGETGGLYEME